MSDEYRKYLAAKLLVLELIEQGSSAPELIAQLEDYLERDPEVRFFQWAGGNLADVLSDLAERGRIQVSFEDAGAEQRFAGPVWDQADWICATVAPASGVDSYHAYLRAHAGHLLKLPALV